VSGINYSAHLYPSAGGYAGVVDVGAAYCQSIGADEGTRTAGAGSQRPYKFVAHCLDMTVGGHKKVDVSDPGVRSRVACSAYGQSRLAKYTNPILRGLFARHGDSTAGTVTLENGPETSEDSIRAAWSR